MFIWVYTLAKVETIKVKMEIIPTKIRKLFSVLNLNCINKKLRNRFLYILPGSEAKEKKGNIEAIPIVSKTDIITIKNDNFAKDSFSFALIM
tara:strand:+ start:53 stop:328 length:276 start_codon:yes stop_codon:yes gene_type:complete